MQTDIPFTPFYQDERCTIYNADCRQVLPFLPKFDLLLTDPPYGIGIASNPVRQAHTKEDWDEMSPADWVIKMAVDCAKFSIVWGGNYFNLPASRKFLVWDKQQPENFSLAMAEQAWCSWEGNAKVFSKRVAGTYVKCHPTQKPEGLIRWCIKQAPEDIDTILDPFMGSGTTLVAANLEGRKAVGIEINEAYCEAAANRLRQKVLF